MNRSGSWNLNQLLSKLSQPPPPLVLIMGKTLVGTMIMTIRNVGTVGPVPETATEAGAGTSDNGTSLHIGLGGTVPTPQQLGKTTGQVLHFIASTLGDPVKQTFCWIPGPSAAV